MSFMSPEHEKSQIHVFQIYEQIYNKLSASFIEEVIFQMKIDEFEVGCSFYFNFIANFFYTFLI